MSKYVIRTCDINKSSQFSTFYLKCPDNETIYDVYRLVILKQTEKSYEKKLYVGNSINLMSKKFREYLTGNEIILLKNLENFLDEMSDDLIEEWFKFLYTMDEGFQYARNR